MTPTLHTESALTAPELRQQAQACFKARQFRRAAELFHALIKIDPRDAQALFGAADAAQALGAVDEALALLEQAEVEDDQVVALGLRRANLWFQSGRIAQATDLLRAMHRAVPDDVSVALRLAEILLASGDVRGADEIFADVLGRYPNHVRALRGHLDVLMALGNTERAVELAREAYERRPGIPMLFEKYVQTLVRAARLDEAEALLTPQCEAAPDALQLHMQLGKLLLETGRPGDGLRRFDHVLSQAPGHKAALLARVDAAIGLGSPEDAFRYLEVASEYFANDAQVAQKRASILHALGQTREAIDTLAASIRQSPKNIRLRLQYARYLIIDGDHGLAAREFEHVRHSQPNNTAAILGLVDAKDAAGDQAGAFECARRQLPVDPDADGTAMQMPPPALLLRFVELAERMDRIQDLRAALSMARALLPAMSDRDLVRLYRVADRAQHGDLCETVILALLGLPRLTPHGASFVLQRVLGEGDEALIDHVVEALQKRLKPGDAIDFRINAISFSKGPLEALAEARRLLPGPRTAFDALKLARRLLDAGQAHLATRYLGFCMRRWPQFRRLKPEYFRSLLLAGRFQEIETFIADMAAAGDAAEAQKYRFRYFIEAGRNEDALALFESGGVEGSLHASPSNLLRLYLSQGRISAAEKCLPDHFSHPASVAKTEAHFRISHLGALLNEMQVYRVVAGFQGDAPHKIDPVQSHLAEEFVYPATLVVDQWRESVAMALPDLPIPDDLRIPASIVQYWDTPEVPPNVDDIMQSWRHLDGFRYRKFSRPEAIEYLRQNFGPDHVRAFRAANNVAEECDFFRLCLLFREGGIYADADDLALNSPRALIDARPGLVLFREALGSISNNVIFASAGHPVMGIALDKALSALLTRDNSSTWAKTGPGLMTRAVASFLCQTEADTAARQLAVLPMAELRQYVFPHVRLLYKSTGKYWDAKGSALPRKIRAALATMR